MQSRGTMTKLGALLKIFLFALDIMSVDVFWIIIWWTNSKHRGNLGILVKISIFSWDNMVFLCGICLLPEKMTLFFSIINKQLSIVVQYLEVFCRINDYTAKCTSSEFIYCSRRLEFIAGE